MAKSCLFCGEPIVGRADKKFCDDSCRNGYNNQKNSPANQLMRKINKILRKNRLILSGCLPEGEETKKVKKDYLQNLGFDFSYQTHLYETKKGAIYHFVYEYGYLELGNDWLLIVHRNSS